MGEIKVAGEVHEGRGQSVAEMHKSAFYFLSLTTVVPGRSARTVKEGLGQSGPRSLWQGTRDTMHL